MYIEACKYRGLWQWSSGEGGGALKLAGYDESARLVLFFNKKKIDTYSDLYIFGWVSARIYRATKVSFTSDKSR